MAGHERLEHTAAVARSASGRMSSTGPTAVTVPSVRMTTVVASRATSATEWLT